MKHCHSDIVYYNIHQLGTPILYILHLYRIFTATCLQDEAIISAEINPEKKFQVENVD
jgi:hypothetical protein